MTKLIEDRVKGIAALTPVSHKNGKMTLSTVLAVGTLLVKIQTSRRV